MLTIEGIKKELDAGREVELECVDREGLAKLTPYVDGLISQEPLTIESWCSDYLYLNINKKKCCQATLSKEELKYFRIKRPSPTFDDLIDAAVQAYKDGIADEIILNDYISISTPAVTYGASKMDTNGFEVMETIEKINSLYTETFVIKEFSDTKKLRSGAKTLLANGEEVFFSNRTDTDDSLWFEYNNCHSAIIPYIALKGATVTQKRGEA